MPGHSAMTTSVLDMAGNYVEVTQSTISVHDDRMSERDRIELKGMGFTVLGGVEDLDIDYFSEDK